MEQQRQCTRKAQDLGLLAFPDFQSVLVWWDEELSPPQVPDLFTALLARGLVGFPLLPLFLLTPLTSPAGGHLLFPQTSLLTETQWVQQQKGRFLLQSPP